MTTSTIAHGGAARTAAFRAAYRAQIAPLYNGLGHVLLIYLIGGAALWYCIQQIHRPTWVEWLIVPVMNLTYPSPTGCSVQVIWIGACWDTCLTATARNT